MISQFVFNHDLHIRIALKEPLMFLPFCNKKVLGLYASQGSARSVFSVILLLTSIRKHYSVPV